MLDASTRGSSSEVAGLTSVQKQMLLLLARQALEAAASGETPPDAGLDDPVLRRKLGCFVTLTRFRELRGCIGLVRGLVPLSEAVARMAAQAALHDPRFPPVRPEELDSIRIEISVLSELRPVNGPEEIVVGTHGIWLTHGFSSGLLLPQVAVEYGWDSQTFLDQTCLKAGLWPGAWQDGSDVSVFTAEIFGEGEPVSDEPQST